MDTDKRCYCIYIIGNGKLLPIAATPAPNPDVPPRLTQYIEVVHPRTACRLEDIAPNQIVVAGGYEELPRIRWVLLLQLVVLTDGGQVLAPQSQIPLGAAVQLLGVLVDGIQGARRCRCCLRQSTAIGGAGNAMLLLLLEQTLSLQLLTLQLELLFGGLRQQLRCL